MDRGSAPWWKQEKYFSSTARDGLKDRDLCSHHLYRSPATNKPPRKQVNYTQNEGCGHAQV